MPLLADADALFVGDLAATSAYLGDVLVWEPPSTSIYDPDTQAFLDASGLGDEYAAALDGLVKDLKVYGLWEKMTAVYPFIGGTADLHKWNLMDPRDTDDAYRLTYTTGSGGHSNDLGYQPNIAYDSGGGYADTHLVPAGLLDPASVHLSLYSLAPLANGNRCDFGAYNWDGTTNRFHLIVHYMAGEFYYSLGHAGMNNTAAGDGSGLFTSSRTSTSQETAYLNGAALASNSTAGGALPPVPLYIGCLNGFIDEFSNLPFGFVSIGSGLTAQNAADLSTVVQDFRLAINERGWKPTMIPGLLTWIDPATDLYTDGERIVTYTDAVGLTYNTDGVNGPIFHTSPNRLEFPNPNVGLKAQNVNLGLDGLTFVFVAQPLDTINYPMMIVSGTDDDGWELRHDSAATQAVERYVTHSLVFHNHAPGQGTAGVDIRIMRITSGVRTDIWVNDALEQFSAASAHNLPLDLFIARRAGGYYWRGDVHEALVFAGPVSDADLALLVDYLKIKHSL
jgi:hypothetical protein